MRISPEIMAMTGNAAAVYFFREFSPILLTFLGIIKGENTIYHVINKPGIFPF